MADAYRSFRSGKSIRTGLAPGLAAAVGAILEAALDGLEDATELVFDESQRQVPVLAPELESSGRVSGELKESGRASVDRARKRGEIHYGTEYADYIHERMDLKHPNGGNAKFVERPLLDLREQELEAIAAKIREVTGG